MQIGKVFFICDRAKLLCLCLYPWLSKATDCLSFYCLSPSIWHSATCNFQSSRFLFLHGIRIHKEISFSYFDERCRPFPFTLNCLLLVVVPRARKATHNTLHGKSHTRKLKGWHNSCFNFDETFEMKNVSKINEQKRQKNVGTLTWTLGELQFCKFSFRITESLAAWSENGERRRLIELNQWAFNLKWKRSVHKFFFAKIASFMAVFVGKWKLTEHQLRKLKIQARSRCAVGVGVETRERDFPLAHVLVRRGNENHMLWETRGFSDDEEKMILLIQYETSWHHKSLRGNL